MQKTSNRASSIAHLAFSITLFLAIFLFLWLRCPQYLLYQEQYQLFLFTADYFAQRMSMPGGLADYISEFVVQFYYVPLYGALLAAIVLTLSQVCLGLACRRCSLGMTAYALSALPPVLCVASMSDENILFSFSVAVSLTSLFLYLDTLRRPTSDLIDIPITLAGFTMLYWFAGPVAFAYLPAVGILRRRPLTAVIVFAAALFLVWGIHRLWFGQYPLSRLLLGINYDRIPEIYPSVLFIIAALIALIPLTTLFRLKPKNAVVIAYASVAVVIGFSVIYVPNCFNEGKSRVFTYNSLVRQGRWQDIIELSEKEPPADIFSLQALNLALGMTGQLTESMFQYPQKGIEGLIGSDRLDNTSQLVTAEALFNLGLTNIAFSTTFDLQEAIMNDRKSGRFMKRMAECMIVNGNYKVAEKYLGMLSHSLFYSDWAEKAGQLIDNDPAVESHPVYGRLRRNSFKETAFYTHPYVERVLAILANESGGANPLAWQYFCAAAMLKGDITTLVGVYNSEADLFPLNDIPRHLQEALAMYWTFSHQSFEGIPYPVTPQIRQEVMALAQAAMKYPDNPAAWQAAAPGSFGVYFLNLQRNSSKKASSEADYISTHE